MSRDYIMGYERFKYGKNKSCCWGLLITGNGAASLTIFGFKSIVLYFNIVLWIKIAPYHFDHLGYALPIVAILAGIFL